MNNIEVRLFSSLRKYQPDSGDNDMLSVQVAEKARLSDLFSELKIPRKEIAIVMVNGKHEKDDYILQNGDRVGIFPMIAGG